jgi:hypothetical protein
MGNSARFRIRATMSAGRLARARLDGDYIVCPWHNWKFHRRSGVGEPGFERDRVPAYPVKVENGRVLVNLAAGSERVKSPHEPHPLSRKVERAAGPLRVAGIATTAMDAANPRFSGSDHLLDQALKAARELGAGTRMIKLNDLNFRACEGYYSKAAYACTWPCSITQMDAKDEMDQVYEALVHWADVVIVSSPIRWGAASSRAQLSFSRETFFGAKNLRRPKTAAPLRSGRIDRSLCKSKEGGGTAFMAQPVAGRHLQCKIR